MSRGITWGRMDRTQKEKEKGHSKNRGVCWFVTKDCSCINEPIVRNWSAAYKR